MISNLVQAIRSPLFRTLPAFLLFAGCATVPLEKDSVLGPWTGPAGERLPTAQSLHGSLVTGYQGWFSTPGHGPLGWNHYGTRKNGGEPLPGSITIEFWPDMSELAPGEMYPTQFKHADGSTAHLFSSAHPDTVDRHFRWMKEYAIDAAFVQRFANSMKRPDRLEHNNTVLRHVRQSANRHGRAYCVMYDLSGLSKGDIETVLLPDFKRLVDQGIIGGDPAYQHHNGKPLVAVWGVGFNDGRQYTLEECEALVDFLQNDPVYGGNTVMLGIPYRWRDQERDAVPDPILHRVLAKADILSPWTVGRYRTIEEIRAMGADVIPADLEWCHQRGIDYLPVINAGFSWHNLRHSQGIERPFDQIPRLDGQFFWEHGRSLRRNGATMAYVAMFDEVDEGTQIFKVTNSPPVGESPFLTYNGLPADHYLWLASRIRALIRGEIPDSEDLPARHGAVIRPGLLDPIPAASGF